MDVVMVCLLTDPLNKVQATSLITAPPAQVPLPKPMMGGAGPYAVDAMLYEVLALDTRLGLPMQVVEMLAHLPMEKRPSC